jgi:plastocyanin
MNNQRHLVTSRLSTGIAIAVLLGCSGTSTPTDPPNPGPGPDPEPAPAPAPAQPTAAVSVGNNVFESGHNGSANPAVDSIAAGGTVTWTWTNTGGVQHSVQSLGSPIFRNSIVKSGDGSTYQVVFRRAGTYQYDCAIHGMMMTGRIVVLGAATPAPTPTPPPSVTPSTAAVTVGDIFFKSGRNGSSNPAVDTVAVNGTVTWTWASNETLPHSVQSLGSPSFTSSAVQQGPGKTYKFTFTAPGTYQYDCAVHGQLMTGSIVVLAAAATTSPSDTATAPATPTPAMPAPSTPTAPLPGY